MIKCSPGRLHFGARNPLRFCLGAASYDALIIVCKSFWVDQLAYKGIILLWGEARHSPGELLYFHIIHPLMLEINLSVRGLFFTLLLSPYNIQNWLRRFKALSVAYTGGTNKRAQLIIRNKIRCCLFIKPPNSGNVAANFIFHNRRVRRKI